MLLEILGWTGSIMVVGMYGLNSYQKIKSDSILYLTFNFLGGILLALYAFYKSAYANVFINVVWILIAVPAIYKLIFRSRS
jgi:hypothetical protein